VRDAISTMPGVTTFTQFGVAYAIAFAIKSGAGVQKVHWFERLGFVLLVVLAVFRAFAWAERLAVIELLVCYLIARLAYLPVIRPSRWRLAVVVPAVGPIFLYLIFTASEYFRSWDFYSHQYDSVWAFTLERLITYYATAVNNGIGMLVDNTKWPYYSGGFVLEWPYLMPGLRDVLEVAVGNPRNDFDIWLTTFARPEFNSTTGYFRAVLDLGYFGSIFYFLVAGYVIGRAYIGYRRGYIFGLLMFPVFVLTLIESLRYSYIGETRFVPLSLGLALVALDIRRLRQQTPG
jgi:oligosaccharide repeat unit polymerase